MYACMCMRACSANHAFVGLYDYTHITKIFITNINFGKHAFSVFIVFDIIKTTIIMTCQCLHFFCFPKTILCTRYLGNRFSTLRDGSLEFPDRYQSQRLTKKWFGQRHSIILT